ncbi:MAG TPA: ABC transporter permease [Candidatus Caenarcaniphilales bacterium]|nr:ABC transporter permease [Candidatus Caenarcaniphilales bacterium]
MIAYVLRRLLTLLPVLLVVGTVTFALVRLTPGDPAAVMLGPEGTPGQVARLGERLGLDEPLPVQYLIWLRDLARLDLGESIFLDKSVTAAILERATPTLQLTFYALILAILIGVPAGVLAAVRPNGTLDRALMLLALGGTAIADFFLAILFILLFAVTLAWLPAGGYVAFSADPLGHVRSMLLPTIALGVSIAGLPARLIRATMLDILHEDYIRTAVAKGLRPGAVAVGHALRNALVPALTVFGATLGDLLGGAVVIETVFRLPGMGQLAVSSIGRRDFPVIQGVVMTGAVGYLLANLLVDVLAALLDPRIADVDERG